MWPAFFNDFSRQYRGQQVTVQVLGRSGISRGRILARRLPLVGITAETDGQTVCSLEIIVGDSPEDHIMHVVNAPLRVRIGQISNGADEVLFVDSQNDPTIRVDFGPAVVGGHQPPVPELWR
jgi:hypothetical protein